MKLSLPVIIGALLALAENTEALVIQSWNVQWHDLIVSDPNGGPIPIPYPFADASVPFPTIGPLTSRIGSDSVEFMATDPDSGPRLRWIGPDGRDYLYLYARGLSLVHTLHASAGTLISGRALYETRCPNDNVWPADEEHGASSVRINGLAVWNASPLTLDPPSDGFGLRSSGWQNWSFLVPEDGTYTLSLDIWSPGCQYEEWVRFESIRTPDDGSLLLLFGVGALAASTFRRGSGVTRAKPGLRFR